MRYRVVFDKPASKQFAHIPKKLQIAFSTKLDSLQDNPKPNEAKKITGLDNCYRIRVGDYRLIYAIIDDRLVVIVIRIEHRRESYKNLGALVKTIKKFNKENINE